MSDTALKIRDVLCENIGPGPAGRISGDSLLREVTDVAAFTAGVETETGVRLPFTSLSTITFGEVVKYVDLVLASREADSH